MFEGPAWLVAQFYALTHNYAIAIGLVALVVMILVTPLTLKSTKGMLEMQRLQPEMRRLQNEYRGDRMKLNEEMMKLYQEHKVNPLASCLPLLLQMPVFFIMYQVLTGLTKRAADGTFVPKYISKSSELYASLFGQTEMISFGLDLSQTPKYFISQGFTTGIVYAGLVVLLGLLYFVQQRMVASRASVSPTMSATQAKVMQYLPVVFAVFQIFFLTGLVIYYITQALFRIGQNAYITRKFYGHDESLGRQAQAAGVRAREEAKASGDTGGGLFAQAKRDAMARRDGTPSKAGANKPGGAKTGAAKTASTKPAGSKTASSKPSGTKPDASKANAGTTPAGKPAKTAKSAEPNGQPEAATNKRVTPPKNRPTPSASRPQRPTPSGRPGGSQSKPPKK